MSDLSLLILLTFLLYAGLIAPPQLIFDGKTEGSLPPLRVLKNPKFKGWNFTVSLSHWSTEETMQEYVDKVCFY